MQSLVLSSTLNNPIIHNSGLNSSFPSPFPWPPGFGGRVPEHEACTHKINRGRRVLAQPLLTPPQSVVLKPLSYWWNHVLYEWCYHNPALSKAIRLEALSWRSASQKWNPVASASHLRGSPNQVEYSSCYTEQPSVQEVGHLNAFSTPLVTPAESEKVLIHA